MRAGLLPRPRTCSAGSLICPLLLNKTAAVPVMPEFDKSKNIFLSGDA